MVIKCFEHEIYQVRKKTANPTIFVKSKNVFFCDFTAMFMGELLHGGIVSPRSKQQCFHKWHRENMSIKNIKCV